MAAYSINPVLSVAISTTRCKAELCYNGANIANETYTFTHV